MTVERGSKAPEFEMPDTSLKMRKLSEFRGSNVILAFFPGAYTSVCTKEMCTLRDSMAKFNNFKVKVVGISVDSPFSLAAFGKENRLNFDLLSDHTKEISKKYGVLHEHFANVPNFSVSKRSVFIVDKEGLVFYKWISDNPGIEPNYKELEDTIARLK